MYKETLKVQHKRRLAYCEIINNTTRQRTHFCQQFIAAFKERTQHTSQNNAVVKLYDATTVRQEGTTVVLVIQRSWHKSKTMLNVLKMLNTRSTIIAPSNNLIEKCSLIGIKRYSENTMYSFSMQDYSYINHKVGKIF